MNNHFGNAVNGVPANGIVEGSDDDGTDPGRRNVKNSSRLRSERMQILQMLENHIITVRDAARLLDVLEEPPASSAPKKERAQTRPRKKLRIEIRGLLHREPIRINVGIPLSMVRFADNIFKVCVPQEAQDSLREMGLNLGALNLRELADSSVREDLINIETGLSADETQQENHLHLRIYTI